MIIKSLSNVSTEELYLAFSNAFVDYPVKTSEFEFKAMLKRKGFDREMSLGAFTNDILIAFMCIGVDIYNDKKTAYDIVTGTIKEYQSAGVATEMFNHAIPNFKNAGIKQFLLEVMHGNDKALTLYQKQGFNITRQFNFFIQDINKIHYQTNNSDITIRQGSLNEDQMLKLNDYHPSWQNNFSSIKRDLETFVILQAFINEQMIGYCVVQPSTGDINQIAVDKRYRRKKIGATLLQKAIKLIESNTVKLVNTDTRDEGITAFLSKSNILHSGKQYEMIKELV